MKKSPLCFILLAAFCSLLFTQQAHAEALVTGRTTIDYNAFTNTVTAMSTTQLDYSAQDWYSGRVTANLKDGYGNMVASTGASDIDRDGEVSVTLQAPGVDQMQFTVSSNHYARPEIAADYDIRYGRRYIDYYGFEIAYTLGPEPTPYVAFVPRYAHGPSRETRISSILTIEALRAFLQTRGEVRSGVPTFDPATITVNHQGTQVSTTIEASTAGFQQGDYAVAEIIRTSGEGQVTYNPPAPEGQVKNIPLVLGDRATANFSISSVSATGAQTFRVRVADIRRPDPSAPGGFRSISSSVTITNSNNTGTLTVRN